MSYSWEGLYPAIIKAVLVKIADKPQNRWKRISKTVRIVSILPIHTKVKVMKNRKNRRSPLSEINVVPYIDVMLVLLVIFMITTPLLSQGVNVNLPQASAQPISPKQQEPIIVSVDAKGQYFLNIAPHPQEPIEATDLVQAVSQALAQTNTAQEPRSVLVKGDQSVDYGKVVQAMVLLQQAGAPNVGLVTASPSHDSDDS